LFVAIIAFISEFVAIRIQQNKRKMQRREPIGEVTLDKIDKEIRNKSTTAKGLDDPEAKQQTSIDLTEICQEICENLESEVLNGSSNIITTIAEVHSH